MGLELHTRLQLGYSHSNKHNIDRKFPNSFDLCWLWSYSLSIEDTGQCIFLHWQNYSDIRKLLMSQISSIEKSITHLSDTKLTEVLLYGKTSLHSLENSRILITNISY